MARNSKRIVITAGYTDPSFGVNLNFASTVRDSDTAFTVVGKLFDAYLSRGLIATGSKILYNGQQSFAFIEYDGINTIHHFINACRES